MRASPRTFRSIDITSGCNGPSPNVGCCAGRDTTRRRATARPTCFNSPGRLFPRPPAGATSPNRSRRSPSKGRRLTIGMPRIRKSRLTFAGAPRESRGIPQSGTTTRAIPLPSRSRGAAIHSGTDPPSPARAKVHCISPRRAKAATRPMFERGQYRAGVGRSEIWSDLFWRAAELHDKLPLPRDGLSAAGLSNSMHGQSQFPARDPLQSDQSGHLSRRRRRVLRDDLSLCLWRQRARLRPGTSANASTSFYAQQLPELLDRRSSRRTIFARRPRQTLGPKLRSNGPIAARAACRQAAFAL